MRQTEKSGIISNGMPYTQDSRLFQRLVAQVITYQDMRQRIEIAEVNEKKLSEFLSQHADEIWASAAPKVGEYNNAEKASITAESEYKRKMKHKPFHLTLIEDILPQLLGLLILSLFLLFSSKVRDFVGLNWPVLLLSLVFVGIVAFVIWFATRGRADVYRAALAGAKAEHERCQREVQEIGALIEPIIIDSIKAHIGEYIDQAGHRPFRLDLPDADTAGFSEVHSQEFEIVTDSRRYVRGLIDKMNGGSIGVAGPRGSGKTTLLRSFCQEADVGPRKLSIFATAPVQYDPREFLLQLFTFVCSRVISKETTTEEQPAWTEMDSLRTTSRLLDTGVFASLALIASVVLFFAGMVLVVAQVGEAPQTPGQSSTSTSVAPTPSAQKSSLPSPNPLSGSAISFFIWSVLALILGIGARFADDQARPTSIGDFYFGPWIRENRRRKKEEEEKQNRILGVDKDALALVERARRTLRGLRFQQSYSSGWSGALKLPIGVEGGTNATISFAERQLGLPEVVHEYREFLKAATKRYNEIIIAIDELDKLESDTAAKTFLNSIKAIFGQEKVYYLISISENAMSNFERRGLPIRDEFDSSFDDAVYINYLDVAASRRLLARRSSEAPSDAYRAFCHVLSGGLPRDLIRYCRKLYDYRRSNPDKPNDVANTCPAMIRSDIKVKLDAIKHNLQRIPDEKKTAGILNLISIATWQKGALRDAITKLDTSQRSLENEASAKDAAKEQSGRDLLMLANILEEIKVFLCFSLVVADTFESVISEARYRELEKVQTFERLAVARQWMAVNRATAVEVLGQIATLPLPPVVPPPQPAGPAPN
jgi:KAP family P-loop domain